MKTESLYKGTAESYIFQLLQQNGRMYGYEISKKIKEITNNNLNLPESKLYPTLHKMEANGLLTPEFEQVGSRLRKYYKLTSKGQKTSMEYLEKLREYIAHLEKLINLKPAVNHAY
ncbi:MAG: PadR family transcriptional regulator [Bacteroidota bacterium]|nr:PadR family transcriptional regulator [Bacteroidota bacterium]